jgi:hypothetical protein
MRVTSGRVPWSRRFCAGALLAVLVGTPGVWLHDGRDDDVVRLPGGSHDPANGHGAAWAEQGVAPVSGHCFLCHTLRSLHPPVTTVAVVVSASAPSFREGRLVFRREPHAHLLPARSPPGRTAFPIG